MNKAFPFLCLIVECIAISTVFVLYSKDEARHYRANIQVPNGMQLTLCNDVHINSGDKVTTIEKGTPIIPLIIRSDEKVEFVYDDTDDLLVVSWSDLNEQNELARLKTEAEQRMINDQRNCLICGSVGGLIVSGIWFAGGFLLNKMFVKKDKQWIMTIVHVLLIELILLVYLLFFPEVVSFLFR